MRDSSAAAEQAQLILGAVSLLVWLVCAFGLAIAWGVDANRPQITMLAGVVALGFAAVPWLAYRPLVRRLSASSRRGIQ